MAITFGFFNSVGGDRKYTAEDIGRYLQGLVSSGVYADSSNSLQVLANDGMTVEVQAGRAMLDFHYMKNDSPLAITLSAGGAQDRIDAIVAYVDMLNRVCDIKIKEGTPAAAPVAPTMERTDVLKEYMLAKVYVTKLATSITQANITDTRADTTVCGWVTGIIKQVDTSTLFLQWQTAYEEAYAELGDYLAAQKTAWEVFFASVTEDLGLPAPALDDAGKAPAVNDEGNGYELREFLRLVAGAAVENANMGGHKITNVGDPENDGDAVPLKYANQNFAPVALVSEEIGVNAAGQLETELKRIYSAMPDNSTKIVVCSLLVEDGLPGGIWHITINKTNSDYGKIMAETYTYAGDCHRNIYEGTWEPWEYENPPLFAGVEYRTTERYNGKAVYRKLISYTKSGTIGSASGVANASVPHGISSLDKLLRINGKVNNYLLPYMNSTGGLTLVNSVSATNIFIDTNNATWTDCEWLFDVAYTKAE